MAILAHTVLYSFWRVRVTTEISEREKEREKCVRFVTFVFVVCAFGRGWTSHVTLMDHDVCKNLAIRKQIQKQI